MYLLKCHLKWLCVCLLVATSNVAVAESLSRWQSPAYIEQAFVEVALRNEYSKSGRFVRKWQEPIRIWLDHQVPDASIHTSLVNMHIRHLSQITAQPITLAKSRQAANLTVVFTQQSAWADQVAKLFGEQARALTSNALCMANFKINKRAEIVSAGVVIPVDQARARGKLVTCIVEEITQTLGLPNDSERVYPSIFNDKTPESLLSGLDGLLLRLLYDPSIKAGLSESQVRPLVRRIIKQWQQDGTLQRAAHDIKSGELYPLLGY